MLDPYIQDKPSSTNTFQIYKPVRTLACVAMLRPFSEPRVSETDGFDEFFQRNKSFFQDAIHRLDSDRAGGIGLVLLHKYTLQGRPETGQYCMVGLRNRFTGEYEFCNGQTKDVFEPDPVRHAALVLFKELQEEMCVRFTRDLDLRNIVIDVIPTGKFKTNLLILACVKGFRSGPIKDELRKRQATPSLPYAWKEMDDCKHVVIQNGPYGAFSRDPLNQYSLQYLDRMLFKIDELYATGRDRAHPNFEQVFCVIKAVHS